MGLLKTIFYLIFFYYAFKFLSRLFAPYILKKAKDSINREVKNNKQRSNVKEGETVIDKTPNVHQQSNNSVGEYVDFEEIDE